MKKNPEAIVQKFVIASRKTAIFTVLSFILSWATSMALLHLKLEWDWLKLIPKTLLVLAFLGFAVCWIAPGALIILGVPQLAHAWLRGTNPVLWSNKPWEQVDNGEKAMLLLTATLFSAAVIAVAFLFKY